MFRARPNRIRPTEVSAKVQTTRPITQHDPGNIVPRSAKPNVTPPRTTKAREPGTSLAAAQPISRTTADASVRAGKNVPRPAENSHRPIQSARPRRPTANPSDPDRSDSPTTDCPADRPARPSQRRGRPEALLKPKLMFSSPA
ncbi:unnamed protein product [Microthlaspi erraticum]|uniref:Uncharacterized protein n=1 Tax=Microthlaspi erraticum TaxID=1685480 RepID=A0A6D2J5R9_9BRAS|nr:unnamed protein product [Microthlaspi erraticum]